MGLLNLFKKKHEYSSLDMDVPPAPPNLEDIPDIELDTTQPKFEVRREHLPSAIDQYEVPAPPRMMQKEEFRLNTQKENQDVSELSSYSQRQVNQVSNQLSEEKETETRVSSNDPLFVRMDRYRRVMQELNDMKSVLKQSEDEILSIENVKHDKEVEFESFKNVLTDVHKKLIYVDKILFQKK